MLLTMRVAYMSWSLCLMIIILYVWLADAGVYLEEVYANSTKFPRQIPYAVDTASKANEGATLENADGTLDSTWQMSILGQVSVPSVGASVSLARKWTRGAQYSYDSRVELQKRYVLQQANATTTASGIHILSLSLGAISPSNSSIPSMSTLLATPTGIPLTTPTLPVTSSAGTSGNFVSSHLTSSQAYATGTSTLQPSLSNAQDTTTSINSTSTITASYTSSQISRSSTQRTVDPPMSTSMIFSTSSVIIAPPRFTFNGTWGSTTSMNTVSTGAAVPTTPSDLHASQSKSSNHLVAPLAVVSVLAFLSMGTLIVWRIVARRRANASLSGERTEKPDEYSMNRLTRRDLDSIGSSEGTREAYRPPSRIVAPSPRRTSDHLRHITVLDYENQAIPDSQWGTMRMPSYPSQGASGDTGLTAYGTSHTVAAGGGATPYPATTFTNPFESYSAPEPTHTSTFAPYPTSTFTNPFGPNPTSSYTNPFENMPQNTSEDPLILV